MSLFASNTQTIKSSEYALLELLPNQCPCSICTKLKSELASKMGENNFRKIMAYRHKQSISQN